eukprot:TRINITY_DN4306_c0_g1_i1.p1 TRINITY_DN4306_c0_g1~~TRINITY_DN4306_c0_g1_i1.p1  ORF type:complete len:1452 (-),score=526.24 TRINITY_DN4306_c0_g1_i1:463-4818(-)
MAKGDLMRVQMIQLLDQCQKTFAVHQRCMKSMKKLYLSDSKSFKREFLRHLHRVLVFFKREPAIERIVQFMIHTAVYLSSKDDSKEEEERDDGEEDEEEKTSKRKKRKKTTNPKDEEEEEDSSEKKNKKKKATSVSSSSKNKKNKNSSHSEKGKKSSPAEEEDEPSENFTVFIIQHLLQVTNSKDKAVRFRSCQILAGLINSLEEIDNSLWDDFEEKMMQRIHDKFPSVRCQAVMGICKLQDPTNKNNPVLQEYLNILNTDASKDVRKAVIGSIGLSKFTIEDVLKRTHDGNEDVRKHTFQVVSNKLPVEKLTIAQRINLLKDGLNDRSEAVRTACSKMICDHWLKQRENNPIKLMELLDVQENEDTVEMCLRYTMQNVTNLGLHEFVDPKKLTPEMAIYWRVYCSYLIHVKEEERLEEALPDISQFCVVIDLHLQDEFVTKQLLLLGRMFDYADEMGRRRLSAFLCKRLPDTRASSGLRKAIMKLLRKIHDENEYIRIVLEVISDVQDPLEGKDEEREESERKRRIGDEEKHRWNCCLAITEDLLENTKKNLNDPGIAGLLQTVILPSIQNPSPEVRASAVKCLGLFCLLNADAAKSHLLLFIQILKNDRDSVKLVAIRVLFDFILVFGLRQMEDQELEDVLSQEYSQSQAIHMSSTSEEPSVLLISLAQHLGHINSEIRTSAAEGFSKLLLADAVSDPKIVAKLLVLFFNPNTENDLRLRQCLSVFFPAYACNTKHQDAIEQACLPTLRVFLRASKASSLVNVSVSQVVQFVMFLLQHKTNHRNEFREKLAITLCNEILLNPTGIIEGKICKALNSIGISKQTSQETIRSLRSYNVLLAESVTDKSALKSLERFGSSLRELDKNPEESLDDLVKKIRDEQISMKEETRKNHRKSQRTVEEERGQVLEDQKSYFDAIDDFDMEGISQPDRRGDFEGGEEGGPDWISERNQLLLQNKKMQQELERLRRMLHPNERTPPPQNTRREKPITPLPKRRPDGNSKVTSATIPPKDHGELEGEDPVTSPSKKKKNVSFSDSKGNSLPPPPPSHQMKSSMQIQHPWNLPINKKRNVEEISANDRSKDPKSGIVTTPMKSTQLVGSHQKKKEEKEKEKKKEEKEKKKEEKEKKKEEDSKDKSANRKEPPNKKRKTEEKTSGNSSKKRKPESSESVNESEVPQKRSRKKKEEERPKKQMEAPPSSQVPEIVDQLPPSTPRPINKNSLRRSAERSDTAKDGNEEGEENEEELDEEERIEQAKLPRSTAQKVLVSFSGFKENDSVFNTKFKDNLIERVILLGGDVRMGELFDAKITHVIAPPNCRTMKTLAASLTGRWLIQPQWVLESTGAGYFVEESKFGHRNPVSPFRDRKVFISEGFKKEMNERSFKDGNIKALVQQLGKGSIVTEENEADFLLIPSKGNSVPSANGNQEEKRRLTWSQFFDLIQSPANSIHTSPNEE